MVWQNVNANPFQSVEQPRRAVTGRRLRSFRHASQRRWRFFEAIRIGGTATITISRTIAAWTTRKTSTHAGASFALESAGERKPPSRSGPSMDASGALRLGCRGLPVARQHSPRRILALPAPQRPDPRVSQRIADDQGGWLRGGPMISSSARKTPTGQMGFHHHRGVSMVCRLGPRHDDCAAGAVAGHRPVRPGEAGAGRFFAQYCSEGMIPQTSSMITAMSRTTNTVGCQPSGSSMLLSSICGTRVDKATFDKGTCAPACPGDPRRLSPRDAVFTIKMDEADGLMNQGDSDTQLTWDGRQVRRASLSTPRQGKGRRNQCASGITL